MKSKKAMGDYILILTFMFLLAIIAVGIVAGVSLVVGKGYEFRQVEADILNYKIKKCIQENTLDETNPLNSICETCRLNQKILESGFTIQIIKTSDGKKQDLIYLGNPQACYLEGAKENTNYPKCANSTITKENAEYLITTGSNQKSRRQIS